MKKVIPWVPLLLAALVGLSAVEAGIEPQGGPAPPADLEECLAALDSSSAVERQLAVRELSAWALDPDYREEALRHLHLARFDPEVEVVLQAEVVLTALAGGDVAAVRAAHGIVPPEPELLADQVVNGTSPGVRLRSLVALGRWHPGAETPALVAATRDSAAAIRLRALEFLLELPASESHDRIVAEALGRARVDPDPAVRRLARR